MPESKLGLVFVNLMIDRSMPSLLEVRVHVTSQFDCTLRLEAGSSKGAIDYETEVVLQQHAPFKSTVYLSDGQKLLVRVKARATSDFIRLTCTEHATMLDRDKGILDNPGRLFDVSLKRGHTQRDYLGKKG